METPIAAMDPNLKFAGLREIDAAAAPRVSHG
jgi:hypothetical protein